MNLDHLRIAHFNLCQARKWYGSIVADQARGIVRNRRDEQEAIDELLFYARQFGRELEAAADARRRESARIGG